MNNGIKVLINFKDKHDCLIKEYGYIVRRLNSHLYEIVGESSTIYFLNPTEFTEINKECLLYGIRDKIR